MHRKRGDVLHLRKPLWLKWHYRSPLIKLCCSSENSQKNCCINIVQCDINNDKKKFLTWHCDDGCLCFCCLGIFFWLLQFSEWDIKKDRISFPSTHAQNVTSQKNQEESWKYIHKGMRDVYNSEKKLLSSKKF